MWDWEEALGNMLGCKTNVPFRLLTRVPSVSYLEGRLNKQVGAVRRFGAPLC